VVHIYIFEVELINYLANDKARYHHLSLIVEGIAAKYIPVPIEILRVHILIGVGYENNLGFIVGRECDHVDHNNGKREHHGDGYQHFVVEDCLLNSFK